MCTHGMSMLWCVGLARCLSAAGTIVENIKEVPVALSLPRSFPPPCERMLLARGRAAARVRAETSVIIAAKCTEEKTRPNVGGRPMGKEDRAAVD